MAEYDPQTLTPKPEVWEHTTREYRDLEALNIGYYTMARDGWTPFGGAAGHYDPARGYNTFIQTFKRLKR